MVFFGQRRAPRLVRRCARRPMLAHSRQHGASLGAQLSECARHVALSARFLSMSLFSMRPPFAGCCQRFGPRFLRLVRRRFRLPCRPLVSRRGVSCGRPSLCPESRWELVVAKQRHAWGYHVLVRANQPCWRAQVGSGGVGNSSCVHCHGGVALAHCPLRYRVEGCWTARKLAESCAACVCVCVCQNTSSGLAIHISGCACSLAFSGLRYGRRSSCAESSWASLRVRNLLRVLWCTPQEAPIASVRRRRCTHRLGVCHSRHTSMCVRGVVSCASLVRGGGRAWAGGCFRSKCIAGRRAILHGGPCRLPRGAPLVVPHALSALVLNDLLVALCHGCM